MFKFGFESSGRGMLRDSGRGYPICGQRGRWLHLLFWSTQPWLVNTYLNLVAHCFEGKCIVQNPFSDGVAIDHIGKVMRNTQMFWLDLKSPNKEEDAERKYVFEQLQQFVEHKVPLFYTLGLKALSLFYFYCWAPHCERLCASHSAA